MKLQSFLNKCNKSSWNGKKLRKAIEMREKSSLAVSCWGAGWLLILLILLYWPMIFSSFFFFPCRRRIVHSLSLAGELHTGLGGPWLSLGERECLFISLFLTLPKGTYPLKMVNGLWLRSVCAALSYLIKYLQPLIGPSGSGPGG